MNSSLEPKGSKEEALLEQGRAIARGISEENARKEKNKATATKRMESTLRNAAQKMFTRNY